MTGEATLLLRGAGAALLAGGLVTLAGGREGAPAVAAAAPAGSLRAAMASRYDASRRGRRLAARLDDAGFDMRASDWRTRQVLLMPVALLVTAVVTGSVSFGLGAGASGVRLGGWLLLRVRSGRRGDLDEEAAGILARHLATELAAGAAPTEAIAVLCGGERARERPRLAAMLRDVLARCDGGDPPTVALGRQVARMPAGRGRDAMSAVVTALELVVSRGSGTTVLARLAAAIEWRRRTRAEVGALTAEVRMAAAAIPGLAGAAAMLLLAADPTIAAAALNPPVAVATVVLAGLAAAGTLAARRVTAVPW